MGKKLSWGMKLACTGGMLKSRLELLVISVDQDHTRNRLSTVGVCCLTSVFACVNRLTAVWWLPLSVYVSVENKSVLHKQSNCRSGMGPLSDLRHAILLLYWTGSTTRDILKSGFKSYLFVQGHANISGETLLFSLWSRTCWCAPLFIMIVFDCESVCSHGNSP